MVNSRIVWIDYAKAFSILFIVMIHAGIPYPLKGLIRVFIIPFFFFISGIFAENSKDSNLLDFLKVKASRILVPYFVFNIITYLYWLIIGRNFGLDQQTSTPVDVFWGIFTATATSLKHYVPLWFLTCLFVVELLYFFILKCSQNNFSKTILIIIVCLISFILYQFKITGLPWSIDIALTMIIFYGLGDISKRSILRKESKSFKYILLLFTIIFISSTVVYIIYSKNEEAKVYINKLGNYLLFMIGAFSGVTLMTSLMKLFNVFFPTVKPLIFVGKNTLIILCLHLISGSLIKGIAFFVFKLPLSIFEQPSITYIHSILSVLLLIPVIIFIQKYLPFILGKFKTLNIE